MKLNFGMLLENLKQRRFDETTNSYVLSPSFHNDNFLEIEKYALESMQEIDQKYGKMVYATTRNIHEILVKILKNHGLQPTVRYQGALRTDTNIRLFGEVEMLFILDETASHSDVNNLGNLIEEAVKNIPNHIITSSDGSKIVIHSEKVNKNITIIPCAWINNQEYLERRNEIYRGIIIYNFKNKTKKRVLPFLNMARMYNKDEETKGGYKRLVRFLWSLATDYSLGLNNYEIASIVFQMNDKDLLTETGKELSSLPKLYIFLEDLTNNEKQYQSLHSPSNKEIIFGADSKKFEDLKKLKDIVGRVIKTM